jgi:Na+/proline symporter
LSDQPARIIPIVLGTFGYTYGSLLGVFLCGIFTKRRGNNLGNVLAMVIGFLFVAIISNLLNAIAGIFGRIAYVKPDWLPAVEFPWWIFFGTIVTFSVAILFRTGREHRPPPA